MVNENKYGGGRDRYNGYFHLDGEELSSGDRQNVVQAVYVRMPRHRRRHPLDRDPFEGLLSDRSRWYSFQDPVTSSVYWTREALRKDSSQRILVSRHRSSRVPISYVVPEGFLTDKPESGEGFGKPDNIQAEGTLITFRSSGNLIAIDVSDRTVRTICEVGVKEKGWEVVRRDSRDGYQFVIRGRNSIEVYSKSGDRMFEFNGSTEHSVSPDFYLLADGSFVITQVERNDRQKLPDGGMKYVSSLVATWLNASGKETRTLQFQNEYISEDIPADSFFVRSVDWFMDNVGPGLVAPEPAVMCGTVFILAPWINHEMSTGKSYQEAVAEVFEHVPYGIPVSMIVALGCAVLCWKRQVRYQAEWTKTWTVFVVLFGLPAWIAWRVHRRWPPLELVTASESDFVGPELNGLEIR